MEKEMLSKTEKMVMAKGPSILDEKLSMVSK